LLEFFDWSYIFIERSLWEENENMKLNQNNLKRNESGDENTTTETKQELTKNECVNITNRWVRNCPKCGKEVSHTNKFLLKYSLEKPCKDCSHRGLKYNVKRKEFTEKELTRTCPNCGDEILYKNIRKKLRADKENRFCRSCTQKQNIKKRPPFSDSSKRKMRQSAIIRLEERFGQLIPNYNTNACKFFNELNEKNGWNLQHAENGGEFYIKELGYWVDAYDRERNIVVEYDESQHYDKNGILKENDKRRMFEIKQRLQCKFLRYNTIDNKLYE